MVIERVHGLHATGLSLNDRFSLLASASLNRGGMRQKRRPIGAFMNTNFNFKKRNVVEQLAWKMELQARRDAIKQRLGSSNGGLRRYGSENNLYRLKRSNSFSGLNQGQNINDRAGWRQFSGNLSRSASFGDLSVASWGGRSRGAWRRGGQRPNRGRFRGGRRGTGRITRDFVRVGQRMNVRGAARGGVRGAGVGRGARGRGRGAAGMVRNQPQKLMTKEELDAQLEQYMSGCKAALDQELDTYMKNAMDTE